MWFFNFTHSEAVIKYADFIIDKLKGDSVFIVASGPSLIDFDYDQLKNKNVITVNHAYKKVNSLWTVAVDSKFVNIEDPAAPYKTVLLSKKSTTYPVVEFEYNKKSYSPDPYQGVWNKKDSGSIALSSALHAGAKEIFLLGFDYYTLGGMVHSTDKEFKHSLKNIADAECLERLQGRLQRKTLLYESFPRDSIYNLSKNSLINYFKKISLSDVKI